MEATTIVYLYTSYIHTQPKSIYIMQIAWEDGGGILCLVVVVACNSIARLSNIEGFEVGEAERDGYEGSGCHCCSFCCSRFLRVPEERKSVFHCIRFYIRKKTLMGPRYHEKGKCNICVFFFLRGRGGGWAYTCYPHHNERKSIQWFIAHTG